MALYPREVAFRKWVINARPGSINNYYTGYLALDRGYNIVVRDDSDDERSIIQWVENYEISALANAAMEAWQANAVHLFQRKLHDMEYQYIAMRRSPHQQPLWMPDGALEIV